MARMNLVAVSILICLLFTGTAHAYMGPGAGLTAIGSLLAFLGIILLAVLGFLWYPIKRMITGRKKKSEPSLEQNTDEPK